MHLARGAYRSGDGETGGATAGADLHNAFPDAEICPGQQCLADGRDHALELVDASGPVVADLAGPILAG